MAIIQCPECGKEVSDNASMCPNCGYNVREHFFRIEQTKKEEDLAHKKKCTQKKIKKYLKIWIPICAFITCVSVAIMWFLMSYGGKTYRHCGIYDTKTKNYIDIGDSREDIEKIVGNGKKEDKYSSSYYEYSDNLDIRYDKYDKAEYIYVNYFSFTGDTGRYTLFDGSGEDTDESEFARKHSYPYKTGLDNVIFLRKNFAGYKEMTKQKLSSLQEKQRSLLEKKSNKIKNSEEYKKMLGAEAFKFLNENMEKYAEKYIEVSFDTSRITISINDVNTYSYNPDEYEAIQN